MVEGKSRKLQKDIVRGVIDSLREWTAGIGLAGWLIGIISVIAEGKQGDPLGIAGIVLGAAGVVCGLLGIRNEGARGWLLALAAILLAIAIFVMLAVVTE